MYSWIGLATRSKTSCQVPSKEGHLELREVQPKGQPGKQNWQYARSNAIVKLEDHYIKDNNLGITIEIKYQISTGSGEITQLPMMTTVGNYQSKDYDETRL